MNEDLLCKLGLKIKSDRIKGGWTQGNLAAQLDKSPLKPIKFKNKKVSENYILRIEKGQRKHIKNEEIKWIADTLHINSRRYLDVLDPGSRNLISDLTDKIKDHHERSSLFAMPASTGDESSDSPQIILLYFYFLMNTEGRLTIIKKEHRYVSLILLTALLSRYTFLEDGCIKTKEFHLHESRELIDELFGAINRHNVLASLDFDIPSEKLIKYISERISVYTIFTPETEGAENNEERRGLKLLQEIADLNPVSYFTLVPYRAGREYSSYYSFGGNKYGELRAHDAEQVSTRFKMIEDAYYDDLKQVTKIPFDHNQVDMIIKTAKIWGINFKWKVFISLIKSKHFVREDSGSLTDRRITRALAIMVLRARYASEDSGLVKLS